MIAEGYIFGNRKNSFLIKIKISRQNQDIFGAEWF
jgi:hypothetical protein